MKTYLISLPLIILSALFLTGCFDSEDKAPITEESPEEIADGTDVESSADDGWDTYENTSIGFRTEYQKDMTLREEGENTIAFSLWGPTQTEDTELFDGLSMRFTRHDLGAKTLRSLVEQEMADVQAVGEITEPIDTIIIDGQEGFEFSGITVGPSQRRIFLPLGTSVALEISILVADPTGMRFESMADRMLSSVELLASEPEINIILDTPIADDLIGGELLISGEARVFENTVNYRLTDDDGNILAEGITTATPSDIGEFGPFEVRISYDEPRTDTGMVEVFSVSAMDGSEINKVFVPVRF